VNTQNQHVHSSNVLIGIIHKNRLLFAIQAYQSLPRPIKQANQYYVFKDLSKNNNGLVAYDKLQERLISTGKFYAGEAVLMIEHMVKTGKIEKTENYNVYK
jgi:hypothetical protein